MYTDIHSHILPGVDDGAKSLEESLALIKAANHEGTNNFIATPHFYASLHSLEKQLGLAKERYNLLLGELKKQGIPVQVVLGFEVRYFQGIATCEELDLLTLNGSKALLLELGPQPITDSIVSDIIELYYQGYTVILAHIERYLKVAGFSKLKTVINTGFAKCQVNATSFVEGPFVKSAYKLIKKGWCHYIAGDMHSLSHRPSKLKEAFLLIEKKFGAEISRKLIENSNRLFENLS